MNPEEWKNVVELMKDTPIWDEVKQLYPDLKTDDEIADEVLAHYSSRRGAERLKAAQKKSADGNGSIFDKAAAIAAIEKVKEALKNFWKGVADLVGIHFTTAEEVADKVMADLLAGVNPMVDTEANRSHRFQFVGEKGAAGMDKTEEATTRLDNLVVAREMEEAKKDAKTIKLATGWERGADGKWRYEIMDGELKTEPKVNEKATSDGDVFYETTLGDILDNEQLLNMTAEERRQSLAEETEDVAREDQIFIMENAGRASQHNSSSMVSPLEMSEVEKTSVVNNCVMLRLLM